MESAHIKALLIEDNPDDALLMQAALEEADSVTLDVEWVERLSIGLERLSQGGIDVVFLDLLFDPLLQRHSGRRCSLSVQP